MMTKVASNLVFASIFSVLVLVPRPAPAQSELEQYLAERRAAAMTEGAERSIRSVASILGGETIFLVEKSEDGSFERSYSTALCLRPGAASPEQQKLKAEIEQRVAAEFERLKAVADFDASGFVTGQEGSRLRDVVEFGLVLEQLPAEDLSTPRSVAKALHRDEAWVSAMAAAYHQLRLGLRATKGTELPEVDPRILRATSAIPSSPPTSP